MPRSRSRSRKQTHTAGRVSAPVVVDSEDKIKKFESLIGPVIVFVFAEWCGHCQNYKPFWKKLENDPNRSVHIASVRDDMVNKTSLVKRANPVTSYPTVLFINEEGKAVNFRDKTGNISQEVPDRGNMETMRALIRSAGTPAGKSILEENSAPELKIPTEPISLNEKKPSVLSPYNSSMKISNRTNTIVTPNSMEEMEEEESPQENINTNRRFNGPSVSPPNIAADVVSPSPTNQKGGKSLLDSLKMIAYSKNPVVSFVKSLTKRKGRKTRRRRRSLSRNRKN
jgi:thiol-disulfide isomerase/thioredoxin